MSGLELEVFPVKPIAKNSFGLDDAKPYNSPPGVYSNLCSNKKKAEGYVGMIAAMASQSVISQELISKKYILIIAYVVIAFSHQISQIGVWKNAPGFGSSMSMIAFAAVVV